MYLKKIVVAGLAVVGTVAMVNAQALITGANVDGEKVDSRTLTMSVEVESVVEMIVNETPITSTQFQTHDPTATSTIKGSLATLDIKCTRANWDVTLKFPNGEFLKSGGTTVPGTTCPENPTVFDPPCTPTGPTTTGGTALKASIGGAPAAAIPIKVSVGVSEINGVAAGDGGDVDITTAKLTAAATDATIISLAKEIGTKLTASKSIDGRAGDVIATAGFAGKDDTTTPRRLWINAGLGLTATDRLAGNPDGEYTGDVIITLVPSF